MRGGRAHTDILLHFLLTLARPVHLRPNKTPDPSPATGDPDVVKPDPVLDLLSVVIKASASAEIRSLIEALSGPDGVRRDAAAARLSVIGARAVERLLAAYERAPTTELRVTVLRVLEPIGDPRSLEAARRALKDDPEVAIAAAQVLKGLLDAREPGVAMVALDALVSIALDSKAPPIVRRGAFDALRGLPQDVRAGVAGLLGPEVDGADAPDVPESPKQAVKSAWTAALEGRLPERAPDLREAIQSRAAKAPLTSLQKLVDALRAREAADQAQAAEWQALRGSVHHALAVRGSRVALSISRRASRRRGRRFQSRSSPPCTAWATARVSRRWHRHTRTPPRRRPGGDSSWRQRFSR